MLTVKAEHIEGSDRYRVRVYDATKKRQVAHYFRATSQRDANKIAAGHEQTLRNTVTDDRITHGTLNGLITDWERQRHVAPTTAYRERSIILRIRQRLGKIPLTELNGQHIAEFYAWLRTTTFHGHGHHDPHPLTEATVHHHYRVLHTILKTGEEWDRIERNPARRTRKPRAARTRITTPTTDQVAQLILAAGPTWGTVFAFTAKTGMRRGEVCGLHWADIHDSTATVHGSVYQIPGRVADKTTKTEEVRDVELDEDVRVLLAHWRVTLERAAAGLGATLSPKARLFPNLRADPTGRAPLKPDTMSQQWRRVCDREGITCRLHSLRHWHASQLVHDGVSIADVAAQLGHAQVSTTANFYTHARESDGRISASMSTALPLGVPR